MYLDIEGIVKEHFQCEVRDVGCHADGKGPTDFYDKGMQHPETEEETFQSFLKRQLTEERENWQTK